MIGGCARSGMGNQKTTKCQYEEIIKRFSVSHAKRDNGINSEECKNVSISRDKVDFPCVLSEIKAINIVVFFI